MALFLAYGARLRRRIAAADWAAYDEIMTKRTSAQQSARQRAAEVRAARQQHEKKVMEALTLGFQAQEAQQKALADLAAAISTLLALGESKSSIANSLGLTMAEVKKLAAAENRPFQTSSSTSL